MCDRDSLAINLESHNSLYVVLMNFSAINVVLQTLQ